jgi:hypothetical protein
VIPVEHPILTRIRLESFTPLGWFEARGEDRVPDDGKFVVLIGNAGPEMFRRFMRERRSSDLLDAWTKAVVDPMADDLGARAIYPFDKPAQPFLTWARRAGAGHTSPLGLNIHPTHGLWHAYRSALVFPVVFDLPPLRTGAHACDACTEKPCLSACPVSAFDGKSYDVVGCGQHIGAAAGQDCMSGGCKARLACPVGREFTYQPPQIQFHMRAFLKARQEAIA